MPALSTSLQILREFQIFSFDLLPKRAMSAKETVHWSKSIQLRDFFFFSFLNYHMHIHCKDVFFFNVI